MKTSVIYARYSSTNQTEQSIEGQVHVCQDYAKRNDILIVDTYVDRAISGTTDNRDEFQRMIKDSANKNWEYVIVYKLDRFARNQYAQVDNELKLQKNGVTVLSAMENLQQTPEGRLMKSVLVGMNQYFSEELAQKVARDLHESRMKGHIIGLVLFGYIKENKMLKINENEAEIVKRIFAEYNNGKTILQIHRMFKAQNITNKGKVFDERTIRKILHSKYYTGEYTLKGKEYNNIYPKIIDKKLFEEVNVKLSKNAYGCKKENH